MFADSSPAFDLEKINPLPLAPKIPQHFGNEITVKSEWVCYFETALM